MLNGDGVSVVEAGVELSCLGGWTGGMENVGGLDGSEVKEDSLVGGITLMEGG